MITIASVIFKNRRYFEINRDLTKRLNADVPFKWILADNELGTNRSLAASDMEVIDGAEPVQSKDAGSLHHAKALQQCLEKVEGRFVLLLDPDFFVLRPNWISDLLAHMEASDLHFFGSVWHPRWYYQYRYFPTVHFMCIDLQKVAKQSLDLLPGIKNDRFWHFINHPRPFLPDWLRLRLKIGRIRDTGHKVYRRYAHDESVRFRTLLPSYTPPPTFATWMESKLGRFLEERWCFVPQKDEMFTSDSFLKQRAQQAYWSGWEEFFWKGEPFAFHLRSVGRQSSPIKDLSLLRRTLRALETPGF